MSVLPLKQFVETYLPVYPTDDRRWVSTVAYMLSEPGEKAIIDALIEDYKRDGHFRTPVQVAPGHEGYEPDEEGYNQPYVRNGTHRVVASILASHETIEFVDKEEEKDYPELFGNHEVIQVKIRRNSPDGSEEMFDDLFDCLRSFRLSEDEWVVSDFSFGGGEATELFYEGIPATLGNIERVRRKVEEFLQMTSHGKHVTKVTAKSYDMSAEEDDWDDDWDLK